MPACFSKNSASPSRLSVTSPRGPRRGAGGSGPSPRRTTSLSRVCQPGISPAPGSGVSAARSGRSSCSTRCRWSVRGAGARTGLVAAVLEPAGLQHGSVEVRLAVVALLHLLAAPPTSSACSPPPAAGLPGRPRMRSVCPCMGCRPRCPAARPRSASTSAPSASQRVAPGLGGPRNAGDSGCAARPATAGKAGRARSPDLRIEGRPSDSRCRHFDGTGSPAAEQLLEDPWASVAEQQGINAFRGPAQRLGIEAAQQPGEPGDHQGLETTRRLGLGLAVRRASAGASRSRPNRGRRPRARAAASGAAGAASARWRDLRALVRGVELERSVPSADSGPSNSWCMNTRLSDGACASPAGSRRGTRKVTDSTPSPQAGGGSGCAARRGSPRGWGPAGRVRRGSPRRRPRRTPGRSAAPPGNGPARSRARSAA
jgi:hypothetical protein